jgi:hypothetical protein
MPESDEATLDTLEFALERERSAIGNRPAIPHPLISPRRIPLPASRSPSRFERNDIKRYVKSESFYP